MMNFLITCIGGDIPAPVQLPNMPIKIYITRSKMVEKSLPLGGDFSIIMRNNEKFMRSVEGPPGHIGQPQVV